MPDTVDDGEFHVVSESPRLRGQGTTLLDGDIGIQRAMEQTLRDPEGQQLYRSHDGRELYYTERPE